MVPKLGVTVSVLGEQAVESKASGNRHTYQFQLPDDGSYLLFMPGIEEGWLPAQGK